MKLSPPLLAEDSRAIAGTLPESCVGRSPPNEPRQRRGARLWVAGPGPLARSPLGPVSSGPATFLGGRRKRLPHRCGHPFPQQLLAFFGPELLAFLGDLGEQLKASHQGSTPLSTTNASGCATCTSPRNQATKPYWPVSAYRSVSTWSRNWVRMPISRFSQAAVKM